MLRMSLAAYPPIAFIPIVNAEAARTFYEQTLGLTFESDDKFAMIFRLAGNIMLRLVKVPSHTPGHFTIFGWEVTDLEAVIDDLTANGLTFQRYTHFQQDERAIWHAPSGAKVAWLQDPDGNVLSLSEHP